jgi:glycosyltransferase involved in cell wall biosynthesis
MDNTDQTYPKISIVTPSYNQGQYIEETILSVLNQNYPNLEYIIIDGGSTDDTVEIIKKYEDQIYYWASEKDDGQSDAINKGLSMATGEILAWINSDDYYLPNCFFEIADAYHKHRLTNNPEFWFIGNCLAKGTINWEFKSKLFTKLDLLRFWDHVIGQPSVFWSKNLIQHPILNEQLHYAMDLDLWLRMRNKAAPIALNADLSVARYYDDTKTSKGDYKRYLEIKNILIHYNDQKSFLSDKELGKRLYQRLFKDYVHKRLILPQLSFYENTKREWKPTFMHRLKICIHVWRSLLKFLIKT